MNYNFDWSAVSNGALYVSISTLGIAFNSLSIERLGSPEKVIVGFDEKNCAIGIKKYDGEEGVKPYKFANRIKNGWVRLGCKGFVTYLQSITEIDFSSAKRYIAKYDAENRVLVVRVKAEDQ